MRVELLHESLDALRRPLGIGLVVRRLDDERQQPRSRECDDGIDDEGLAPYTAYLSEGIVRLLRIPRGVVAEICLSYLYHEINIFRVLRWRLRQRGCATNLVWDVSGKCGRIKQLAMQGLDRLTQVVL